MSNKDVILKDQNGDLIYPIAHADSDKNPINTTYLKGVSVSEDGSSYTPAVVDSSRVAKVDLSTIPWLKSASVSGRTLTLTKHDGNTVTFNDTGSIVSGTNDGTNWTSITIDGNTKNVASNVEIDNESITKNTDDELQAVGVIDSATGNANMQWTGTLAQYDAIATKDPNTIYYITDDETSSINIADYIVEQGVSNTWTYRKWNSGIAECWCTASITSTVNTSWGSANNISSICNAPNYPFTFSEMPCVTITASNNTYTLFTVTERDGTTTSPPPLQAVRPSGTAISSAILIKFSIYAIGRWQ